MSDNRSASKGTQSGAGEQSNALSEAFPLIAAGVLVIVGLVLFVTVLWPDSGTSERTAVATGPAARSSGANAPPTTAAVDAPKAAPEEPPKPPAPPAAPTPPPELPKIPPRSDVARVAPQTQAPERAAPSETPTKAASPPAPDMSAPSPAVSAMLDAAIAGDGARLQSAMKELAGRAPARGDRTRARTLNAKALEDVRGARYAAAIPLFEAAHRADPGDPEVRENLGYALLKAGRLEEAEAALLSALEVAPRRASAWGSLGFLYAKRNRKDAAVKLIETAYRLATDRRKAAEAYRRQAKSDPDPKVREMLTEAVARLNQTH